MGEEGIGTNREMSTRDFMPQTIDLTRIEKLLEYARPEYRSAPHGGPAVGYKYPNCVDAALMEIQFGLLIETKELIEVNSRLLKETRILGRLTWVLLALTAILAVLAAGSLVHG